ncbi:MAG: hypothetical protein K8F36_14670 [Melioribacteraceae bacterium]|nr:hypothetical protein [Melioribacteraceae bacterium]MCO6474139.1 hypothetical protein [Melioribacteraceae bacterium]MDD3558465.1 hypothetical protein [Melioribacteraceae bacterium]
MKHLLNSALAILIALFFSTSLFAQTDASGGQVQNKFMKQYKTNWVDADGDGICDNFGTENQGQGRKFGRMNKGGNSDGRGGYGDGSGIRPQDGTGFGPGNGNGTGVCDGTGPKGNSRRGGRK